MSPPEIVLSASRRTDIPAFYLDWFMDSIDRGRFDITHPFTRKPRQVLVNPETSRTIVFWSKNFGPFLEKNAGKGLQRMGYNLFFNFTVNSASRLLEPGMPKLTDRLAQLEKLAGEFGPGAVAWRFDPICAYRLPTGEVQNNLGDFERIARTAASAGITRCVTSFLDPYRKIDRRIRYLSKAGEACPDFISLTLEEKTRILKNMAAALAPEKISLNLCCERELFSALPDESGIRENACIDGPHLEALFGGSPDRRKDTGQRAAKGCRCTRSVDIGSYDLHPCPHNCLFCYANPEIDSQV